MGLQNENGCGAFRFKKRTFTFIRSFDASVCRKEGRECAERKAEHSVKFCAKISWYDAAFIIEQPNLSQNRDGRIFFIARSRESLMLQPDVV